MASSIPYLRHVFVCTNSRPATDVRGCCSGKQSEEIRARLKEGVKKHGIAGSVRVNAAGCLDFCSHGVTIVVYPENTWYGRVQLSDVDEIILCHLVGGRPVERLRLPDDALRARANPAKP